MCVFTCWSTPTASRPSYMMLTQPSLHDSTNSDIRAWKSKTHINHRPAINQFVRAGVSPGCVYMANLSQVVKVVFPPNPAVSCFQALGFIGDVTHVKPLTVEEFPFKQLHIKTDVYTEIKMHKNTVTSTKCKQSFIKRIKH